MSCDDWVLKERTVSLTTDFIGYSLMNTGKEFYMESTIETLRQKLINDVEDLFSNSDWTQDFVVEMKELINKRFGVV